MRTNFLDWLALGVIAAGVLLILLSGWLRRHPLSVAEQGPGVPASEGE